MMRDHQPPPEGGRVLVACWFGLLAAHHRNRPEAPKNPKMGRREDRLLFAVCMGNSSLGEKGGCGWAADPDETEDVKRGRRKTVDSRQPWRCPCLRSCGPNAPVVAARATQHASEAYRHDLKPQAVALANTSVMVRRQRFVGWTAPALRSGFRGFGMAPEFRGSALSGAGRSIARFFRRSEH
jgi:hypothetical protein